MTNFKQLKTWINKLEISDNAEVHIQQMTANYCILIINETPQQIERLPIDEINYVLEHKWVRY